MSALLPVRGGRCGFSASDRPTSPERGGWRTIDDECVPSRLPPLDEPAASAASGVSVERRRGTVVVRVRDADAPAAHADLEAELAVAGPVVLDLTGCDELADDVIALLRRARDLHAAEELPLVVTPQSGAWFALARADLHLTFRVYASLPGALRCAAAAAHSRQLDDGDAAVLGGLRAPAV